MPGFLGLVEGFQTEWEEREVHVRKKAKNNVWADIKKADEKNCWQVENIGGHQGFFTEKKTVFFE